jgi:hypothetical protein
MRERQHRHWQVLRIADQTPSQTVFDPNKSAATVVPMPSLEAMASLKCRALTAKILIENHRIHQYIRASMK